MTKLSERVSEMKNETAVKNKKIMDAIFDNIDCGIKDISLAVLDHHNTCMINTLENKRIDSNIIKSVVKDIVTDVVDYLDEEFNDEDIPYITCAIASQFSLSVFESLIYANKRVEERKIEEAENQVDKSETAKRVAEVYKAGKVSNEDLAKMIECNSITLGGIADHLGMDIANEVLRIASENLENKKEAKEDCSKTKKDKDMEDFLSLLDKAQSMTFEEFSNEMNKFDDEMKLSIMEFAKDNFGFEPKERNPKVIAIPIKGRKTIYDILEALIKEAE